MMSNVISIFLWGLFLVLIGCVLIFGPSTVSVDHSVKRPVLEQDDTNVIDWIDWND